MLPIIDTEFKALIPPLSLEERTQLEHNICHARKCHDAIILWDGIIIDGHNRFEICMEHGIEFKIRDMSFSSRQEAKVWILENQLARRNLSDAARIEMVLLKEGIMREKAKKRQKNAGGDRKSEKYEGSLPPERTSHNDMPLEARNELAAQAGVSNGNFSYYIDILKNGCPQLINKVKSGEMKIGTAHRLLKKETLKELRKADKMYKAIAEYLPHVTEEAAKSQINNGLDGLAHMLQELISLSEERSRNESLKNQPGV